MELKKFGNFINEDMNSEPSFTEKLEGDLEILDEVKSILTISLESVGKYAHGFKNAENFEQWLMDNLVVDATNLVDFDISKQIDLCIYAEEFGYEKCPETEWNFLTQKINDGAIDGLSTLTSNVIKNVFIDEFNEFMTANKLDYSNISHKEGYGHAAPERVKHIQNGELNQYRKLDGEFNVDEYIYRNDELGVELFIEKKLK